MIQSVLITGGGSGIGAALARALADRQCRVIVAGRRQERLDAIAGHAPNITALAGDVNDAEFHGELAETLSGLPAPRAVFHGAGHFQLGRLVDLSMADWERSFTTNVTARFALSTRCAPHLTGGRILFIGSDSAVNVRVGGAAYSIAQAASQMLRKAMQAELVEHDIAVSAFKPGLVNTDMVRGFLAHTEAEFPARAAFQTYIDQGEYTTPETVAAFATWLLMAVERDRFTSTEWDIRHTDHHGAWLQGALYGS